MSIAHFPVPPRARSLGSRCSTTSAATRTASGSAGDSDRQTRHKANDTWEPANTCCPSCNVCRLRTFSLCSAILIMRDAVCVSMHMFESQEFPRPSPNRCPDACTKRASSACVRAESGDAHIGRRSRGGDRCDIPSQPPEFQTMASTVQAISANQPGRQKQTQEVRVQVKGGRECHP